MSASTESSKDRNKVLTVSIAAYNVEQYIEEALESCLVPEIDLLDIIVVDDGATDGTADKADDYAQEYPQSIRVVRKENGGYGSTVNTSLELARGTYFRLLDGDDWFDKTALSKMLEALSGVDVDLVVSPFNERSKDSMRTIEQAERLPDGVHEFLPGSFSWFISMHSMIYRTELLRECGVVLPERRLYTDAIFSAKPLSLVHKLFISHTPIYQYRLDRLGQSMSPESLVKNRFDNYLLMCDLLEMYLDAEDGTAAKEVLSFWTAEVMAAQLRTLYYLPVSSESREEIDWLLDFSRACPEIYSACLSRSKWFRLLAQSPKALQPLLSKLVEKAPR